MLLLIGVLLFFVLFIFTEWGMYVLYSIYRLLTLIISSFFNCFILLGTLMLIVKVRVTLLLGMKHEN